MIHSTPSLRTLSFITTSSFIPNLIVQYYNSYTSSSLSPRKALRHVWKLTRSHASVLSTRNELNRTQHGISVSYYGRHRSLALFHDVPDTDVLEPKDSYFLPLNVSETLTSVLYFSVFPCSLICPSTWELTKPSSINLDA